MSQAGNQDHRQHCAGQGQRASLAAKCNEQDSKTNERHQRVHKTEHLHAAGRTLYFVAAHKKLPEVIGRKQGRLAQPTVMQARRGRVTERTEWFPPRQGAVRNDPLSEFEMGPNITVPQRRDACAQKGKTQ